MKPGTSKKHSRDESWLDSAEGEMILEESVYEEVDHYYDDSFRDSILRGELD